MFFLLPLSLAQINPVPTPPPQTVVQPQEIRALPGKLDSVLLFNSNSPEVIQTEGILLSTFPPNNKQVPTAHLNRRLQGRFNIFAHHIAKAQSPTDLKPLYLGIILNNPSRKPVTVSIHEVASYLSQPDAPFIQLPPYSENSVGNVYAGPGDRVMNDLLRGLRQPGWPTQLVLPPGQSQMLMNLPIPVRGLVSPINGRSTLMQLYSNGPVHAASLALFARLNPDGSERAPNLEEWQTLLQTGKLAGPRDKVPTPLSQTTGKVIYGRVAGIAQGITWQAQVANGSKDPFNLTIPQPGKAFSYVLSTVNSGTFGTGQVQSGLISRRYPDTAYRAHGNYSVKYDLSLPLYNASNQLRTVTLAVQTPLKTNKPGAILSFTNPPARQVFFRGTVRLRYRDDEGLLRTRYIHLVQQRGQQGEPLVTLNLPSRTKRLVQVEFLYPPDSTPPQVLTVRTLGSLK